MPLFRRKSDRKSSIRRPSNNRLGMESLERRLCMFAPTINTFTSNTGAGNDVTVSGHVVDEFPTSVVVTFGGKISGSVSPNAQGNFSFSTTASSLGTVTAVAVDNENLSSSTANSTLTSAVPTVTMSVNESAADRMVTLSGKITDETLAGRTVTFSGKVSGTATTDSLGNYSFTAQASALGTISVVVSDPWGQASATVVKSATSTNPTIVTFLATEGTNENWTFTGTVEDEFPIGLTVTFGGILQGRSAVVQSDKSFTLTLQIAVGVHSNATAQVTDWWGLVSAIESVAVNN